MLIIIPTVDAEGIHGSRPFEQMMIGITDGGERYGVDKISEVFETYGIRVTFFLDVYEHTIHGREPLEGVCNRLLKRGHDIQLHTHPSWRRDPRDSEAIRELKRERAYFPQSKDFMYKCTLEEQVEILEHGIECMEQWCGKRPVAHRAGGYGVNQDTIRALCQVGIPVDSSMHHLHPHSRQTWSINKAVVRDGILEVPVTGFQRWQSVSLGPIRWIRKFPFWKTDIKSCSLDDMLWFVAEAKTHNLRVMTLFLHSYSLLDYDQTFSWFGPNHQVADKLNQFLSATVEDPHVAYISIDDVWRHHLESPHLLLEGADYLPIRKIRSPAIPLLVSKARQRFRSLLRRRQNC